MINKDQLHLITHSDSQPGLIFGKANYPHNNPMDVQKQKQKSPTIDGTTLQKAYREWGNWLSA